MTEVTGNNGIERRIENINMFVVNLTPHDINICDPYSKQVMVTIPASGKVVRVNTEEDFIGNLCQIPIVETKFNSVEGLPDSKPETWYIVSRTVKDRVPDRKDVLCPDTGSTAVRYTKEEDPAKAGQIKGVIGFTY